jgi:hypothetical protein
MWPRKNFDADWAHWVPDVNLMQKKQLRAWKTSEQLRKEAVKFFLRLLQRLGFALDVTNWKLTFNSPKKVKLLSVPEKKALTRTLRLFNAIRLSHLSNLLLLAICKLRQEEKDSCEKKDGEKHKTCMEKWIENTDDYINSWIDLAPGPNAEDDDIDEEEEDIDEDTQQRKKVPKVIRSLSRKSEKVEKRKKVEKRTRINDEYSGPIRSKYHPSGSPRQSRLASWIDPEAKSKRLIRTPSQRLPRNPRLQKSPQRFYSGPYSGVYGRPYSGVYGRPYSGVYSGAYPRLYSGVYSRPYSGPYSGAYGRITSPRFRPTYGLMGQRNPWLATPRFSPPIRKPIPKIIPKAYTPHLDKIVRSPLRPAPFWTDPPVSQSILPQVQPSFVPYHDLNKAQQNITQSKPSSTKQEFTPAPIQPGFVGSYLAPGPNQIHPRTNLAQGPNQREVAQEKSKIISPQKPLPQLTPSPFHADVSAIKLSKPSVTFHPDTLDQPRFARDVSAQGRKQTSSQFPVERRLNFSQTQSSIKSASQSEVLFGPGAKEIKSTRLQPSEIPKEIPKAIPKEIPKAIPKEIPKAIPKEIPKAIPKAPTCDIKGLRFVGNSCYQDTVFVALFAHANPIIDNYILNARPQGNPQCPYVSLLAIQNELRNIANVVRNGDPNPRKTCREFREILRLCQKPEDFSDTRPHDVSEFLQYIFDIFNVETVTRRTTTFLGSEGGPGRRTDLVERAPKVIMEGPYQRISNRLLEETNNIHINAVFFQGDDASLEQPIREGQHSYYFRREISIIQNAEYLVIGVERLTPDGFFLNKPVRYSMVLTVPLEPRPGIPENILTLSAIILWKSGHYTAYVLCPSGNLGPQWWYYDDLRGSSLTFVGEDIEYCSHPPPSRYGVLFFYIPL